MGQPEIVSVKQVRIPHIQTKITAPDAQITVFINSEEEIVKKFNADKSGGWLYKFDTSETEYGDHTTRARAAKSNDISIFSQSLAFKVGEKNIAAKAIRKCVPMGDLNNDCRVNLVDFSIAAYWWKKTLTDLARENVDANLYQDGKIDLRDFSIMAYYWTG